jgi:hypothetical protein
MTSLCGSRLLFVALLAVFVTMGALLAPDAAYATCCQIKFSDPDLLVTGLPKCPADAASCEVGSFFTDIDAITLQCPQGKGQNDPGCNVNGHQRIELVGQTGSPEDCTGRGCKFNVKDVFTLEQLAATIERGLDVVQFTDAFGEVCPAVVPTFIAVQLTGCRLNAIGNQINAYFIAQVEFPELFTGIDDLCLDGNFRGQIVQIAEFSQNDNIPCQPRQ